jgi:hypothetical protein
MGEDHRGRKKIQYKLLDGETKFKNQMIFGSLETYVKRTLQQ